MSLLNKAGLGVLLILAMVSLAHGFMQAIQPGKYDFQYSPTRMLLDGQNAYALFLSGYPFFLPGQTPNYLPLLYEVLTPVALFPWHIAKGLWAGVNTLLALFIAYRLYNRARWGRVAGGWLALIFLTSIPVRSTIAMGQHGLLIVACLVGLLSVPSPQFKGLFLALACTKYSIGAFFMCLFAGLRRWWVCVMAMAVILLSDLLFAWITHTPFTVQLLLAPVTTGGRGGMFLPPPFDVFRQWLGYDSAIAISLTGLLFVWACSSWGHARRRLADATESWEFLLFVSVLSCLFFSPHARYDYVLLALLFLFCSPFAWLSRWGQAMFAGVLMFHWNGATLARVLLPENVFDLLVHGVWACLGLLMVDLLRNCPWRQNLRASQA